MLPQSIVKVRSVLKVFLIRQPRDMSKSVQPSLLLVLVLVLAVGSASADRLFGEIDVKSSRPIASVKWVQQRYGGSGRVVLTRHVVRLKMIMAEN